MPKKWAPLLNQIKKAKKAPGAKKMAPKQAKMKK
jgi:hypothetical protein